MSDPREAGGAYRISRLRLTDFRNYPALALDPSPASVALTGANGSGKTNLLEAISLIVPGRGLRGASLADLPRDGGAGDWAVFARVEGPDGPADIGTGVRAETGEDARAGREAHVSGKPAGINELASWCRMVWLTPAMDQLFAGPGSERRRFLDRLVLALDPGHRARVNAFETAMRQRNALLEDGARDARWLDAVEAQMAEHATAVAAARRDCVRLLQGAIAAREGDAFPPARLGLEGDVEADLDAHAAVDAEDRYRARLAAARHVDAAARRTLSGPHRSDLVVVHGPKGRAASSSSTGEQKIMLVGIVLAHARLVRDATGGATPLVLLDEVAAHLDEQHRLALFAELAALGAQAWMTGTDAAIFAQDVLPLQRFSVAGGAVTAG